MYIAYPNVKDFNTSISILNKILIIYVKTSTKLVDIQAAKMYEFPEVG